MTTQRTVAMIVVSLLVASNQVHGHRGDIVIPIFEITDEALGQIDLHDSSVYEWEDRHEPAWTSLDFIRQTERGKLPGLIFSSKPGHDRVPRIEDLSYPCRDESGWMASPSIMDRG